MLLMMMMMMLMAMVMMHDGDDDGDDDGDGGDGDGDIVVDLLKYIIWLNSLNIYCSFDKNTTINLLRVVVNIRSKQVPHIRT